MRGIDVFCERCGARQPTERREHAPSSAKLARRLASAVSRTADGVPEPQVEMFLRLCLECRGYSCPACWNEAEGLCQSCAPMPVVEVQLPVVELPPPMVVEAPSSILMEPPPMVVEPPRPVQLEPPPPPMAPVIAEPVIPVEPEPVNPVRPEPVAPPPAPVYAEAATAEPAEPAPAAPEPAAPEPPARPAPMPLPPVMPRPMAPPPVTQHPLPLAASAPATAPYSPDPVVPAPVVPPRPRPSITFDVPPAVPTSVFAAAIAPPPPPREYLPVPQRPSVAAAPAGVRPCRSCQLPLSAKAHFCRRCGSSQES